MVHYCKKIVCDGKTQKLIAVPKIILSQDLKTTFLKTKSDLNEKDTVSV